MAVIFPLTFPAEPAFTRFVVKPLAFTAITRSPFTGQQQVFAHQGGMWQVEAELPPMLRAQAEAWLSMLVSLNGMEGTFLLGDVDAKTPRGSVSGTPLVNGAGQTGRVLETDGWTASALGVLLAGDYIQLGSGATTRLYKVMQDVDADGTGAASIDIWPRLRESPEDNEALVTSNTRGTFRLASNEQTWETDRVGLYLISFSAIEAF